MGVLLAALRRRARSVGARFFGVAVVLGLGFAILLPTQGGSGASVALESAWVVIGVGAALVAAASAGSLPDDRGSGVHAWLAATACPRPMLRAAPAVAGVMAAVATAVVGALVTASLFSVTGIHVPTRVTTPLRIEENNLPSAARSTTIHGLDGPAGAQIPVELEIRPHFRTLAATGIGTVNVAAQARQTSADGGFDEFFPIHIDVIAIPTRGRVDVSLPEGRYVTLDAAGTDVELSFISARRIDGPASFLANVLRGGLLLGLALACLAPIAVLLSRFLSASTAVTAALVLGAIGVLHGPLLGLAADASGVAGGAAAGAILRGATVIAPDLSVVSATSASLVGHVMGASEFAGLVAPSLHALAAFLLLAFLPARKVDA